MTGTSNDDGRTPERHPAERITDKTPFWRRATGVFWQHKLYRDLWLVAITGIALHAIALNGDRVNDIQRSRSDVTYRLCGKLNEAIDGTNAAFTTLQRLFVSQALYPGDKSLPNNERDPLKWNDIKPGPLSDQIERLAPQFPDTTERLRRARARADQLHENFVGQWNCVEEIKKLEEAQQGKK